MRSLEPVLMAVARQQLLTGLYLTRGADNNARVENLEAAVFFRLRKGLVYVPGVTCCCIVGVDFNYPCSAWVRAFNDVVNIAGVFVLLDDIDG